MRAKRMTTENGDLAGLDWDVSDALDMEDLDSLMEDTTAALVVVGGECKY